ncbi:hypothetical protein [Ewingella americana]|uniref:hypothetical protein n=1 Tax=Ewingella americana TaxID=41202 RepID=UPI00163A1A86|nr:hypothetical protein [Ewingella americana]QMV50955.1 hypothetical protein GXP68_05995 [Ewingella americana]
MNERDMSLLRAVGEAVREQMAVLQEKYQSALSAQSLKIEELQEHVKELLNSPPDEGAIIKAVLAQIEAPAAPELPDIEQMVKDAVNALPQPQPPEPAALPDIAKMVSDAISGIEIPAAPELPDIQQMVKDAVSALPLPKDGNPGNDGKDALQVEILPCLDDEKSYPRGTYALHNGGLWRSFQKTTGMNGWECLVDGIASIDITQNHEREFTVSAKLASGAITDKSFSVPVMIYRDIFKEGEKYQPGDSVTWAGSVWYCHAETTDKPGEPSSKGWKLAVKRGRDARQKT